MKYWLRKLWHKWICAIPLWEGRCSRCGGHGVIGFAYDPSPAGVSLSPGFMYDWDPCSYCSDKGIGPSCGEQLSDADAERVFSDSKPCPFCKWTHDTPNDWRADEGDDDTWPDGDDFGEEGWLT